jgi:hypothetical protein
MKHSRLAKFALIFWVSSQLAFAKEESLDLSAVSQDSATQSNPAKDLSGAWSHLKLMGRFDLTYENTPYHGNTTEAADKFKNYHTLLFLKAEPSKKVHFMGEFVRQSFFDITYEAAQYFKVHLGKILVPFGDTSRFHHLYGGILNYGDKGVMLPNIWAESGVQLETEFYKTSADLYYVNGFTRSDPTSDIDLRAPSNGDRQAGGLRLSFHQFDQFTLILSGYYEEYSAGHPLYLYGADAKADYGFLKWGFLQNLRLSAGRAQADIRKGVTGSFKQTGDYLELATNLFPWSEFRARYGTYIHDNRTRTTEDSHNFNLGILSPIDVLQLLIEYQWNFEAVNEVKNDVLRVMVSLDF